MLAILSEEQHDQICRILGPSRETAITRPTGAWGPNYDFLAEFSTRSTMQIIPSSVFPAEEEEEGVLQRFLPSVLG